MFNFKRLKFTRNMKRVLVSAACILASGALFAQKPAAPKTAAKQAATQAPAPKKLAMASAAAPGQKPGAPAMHHTGIKPQPNAIGGYIRDNRSRPIKGAKAFIYMADSSIAASGYTDSSGFYQTNSVAPGKYNVKLIYPNYKTIYVTGVVIKKGITPVNFKADMPAADTTVAFADILPKPESKKGTGKKK